MASDGPPEAEPVAGRRRRRANIRDVARVADVSIATVSRVLNGSAVVDRLTTQRVQSAIKELHYTPDARSRALFGGTSAGIGVLVGDLRSPFYWRLARGITRVAAQAGSFPLLAETLRDPEVERQLVRLLDEQRVRGLVVTVGPAVDDLIAEAARHGTRCVVVTREFEPPRENVCSIRLDDVRAGRMAWEHLHANGRRRIGVVMGSTHLSTQRLRLQGIRSAAEEAGQSWDDDLVVSNSTVQDSDPDGAIARLLTRARPRKHMNIDAVIATSGLISVGVLATIRRLGIRVPEDVAIVGFDDSVWAPLLSTPLTVIDQPATEMGARAARLILDDDDAEHVPSSIVMSPSLVVRESSGGL